jgi:hypothetical protein
MILVTLQFKSRLPVSDHKSACLVYCIFSSQTFAIAKRINAGLHLSDRDAIFMITTIPLMIQ